MIFGEQMIALKEDGKGMYIWGLASRSKLLLCPRGIWAKLAELENEITFHPNFIATTVHHPATYLNKVVVGGQSGELQLWNIRTWYVHQIQPSS